MPAKQTHDIARGICIPAVRTRKQENIAGASNERNIDQDTAPRDMSIRIRGRYPGSQDLTHRLPMNWRIHSGIRKPWRVSLIRPRLLTVAGAAQASGDLHRSLTWFPFNLAAKRSGTSNEAAFYQNRGINHAK